MLDEYVRELVSRESSAAIQITGPEGCGKTTALCHLASVFPDQSTIVLLDNPEAKESLSQSGQRYVVFATQASKASIEPTLQLQMAKWTIDDLIEYWMSCHRDQCRKANLRGADLRGAVLGSTDFYLVDLQRRHIRHSR